MYLPDVPMLPRDMNRFLVLSGHELIPSQTLLPVVLVTRQTWIPKIPHSAPKVCIGLCQWNRETLQRKNAVQSQWNRKTMQRKMYRSIAMEQETGKPCKGKTVHVHEQENLERKNH
jgi:hypothetical protein